MSDVARRVFLAGITGAAIAACTRGNDSPGGTPPRAAAPQSSTTVSEPSPTTTPPPTTVAPPVTDPAARPVLRLIGDGSTADTGPQPGQPVPERLKAGQAPPQFVVFSWDGAGNTESGQFARFRSLAQSIGASMTFFLTGTYTLPVSERNLYLPPQHPVGSSAIGLFDREGVLKNVDALGRAWLEGHEIGTHFNGHFCGDNGVGRWSPAEWTDEIGQAINFVRTWKTNTGATELPPLPFDYEVELVGGRAPCLEGQPDLLPAIAALGWRYDASSPGGAQVWPQQREGVWDLPLQAIPFAGPAGRHALSMDYNIMYKQNGGEIDGDPTRFAQWRTEARDTYLAGFEGAYTTNRAPLFIGNHFEQWNGGIYMDAVEEAMTAMSTRDDVRIVSFRQFVDWLDVQEPAVLDQLRTLTPGTAPPGGWATFLA